MSKIELPPLPRPIYAASCGKDPFYTADHILADRRQIVELCASLADNAHPHDWPFIGAAIRSLLDPASPSSLPAEQQESRNAYASGLPGTSNGQENGNGR